MTPAFQMTEDDLLFRVRILTPEVSDGVLYGPFFTIKDASDFFNRYRRGRGGWIERLAFPAWVIADDTIEYTVVRADRLAELLRIEQVVRLAAQKFEEEG